MIQQLNQRRCSEQLRIVLSFHRRTSLNTFVLLMETIQTTPCCKNSWNLAIRRSSIPNMASNLTHYTRNGLTPMKPMLKNWVLSWLIQSSKPQFREKATFRSKKLILNRRSRISKTKRPQPLKLVSKTLQIAIRLSKHSRTNLNKAPLLILRDAETLLY